MFEGFFLWGICSSEEEEEGGLVVITQRGKAAKGKAVRGKAGGESHDGQNSSKGGRKTIFQTKNNNGQNPCFGLCMGPGAGAHGLSKACRVVRGCCGV